MSFLRGHPWLKIIIGIALMPVIIPIIFIVGLFLIMGFLDWNERMAWNKNQLPFDQKVWLAETDSKEMNPMRLRMVEDLLKHHDFRGFTRKQVEDLLGPETDTDKFRSWDLVYWLGPERGSYRIDSEWLVFRFDRNDVVSDYQHLTD